MNSVTMGALNVCASLWILVTIMRHGIQTLVGINTQFKVAMWGLFPVLYIIMFLDNYIKSAMWWTTVW